jgi:membrane protease subunit (stomatin/prohibitin family)
MAKFVTECPNCNDSYIEVNSDVSGIIAFFKGEKTNVCSNCKYKYQKKDRLTAKQCTYCGNNIVYDRSKGEDALCPVCKRKVNTLEELAKTSHFPCHQCGCDLSVKKGHIGSFTCPICELVITQKEIEGAVELGKVHRSGLASVIKYEGDNTTFVWKHPVEDFNIGSQLIVHESQEAIFFRNGQALDIFPAGRYTLETESIPLINQMYNSVLNPQSVFHSEVYFINLTTQMSIKWGTDSQVRFLEPITGIPFEIGACGEFNLRVSDSKRLVVKLVGTEGGLNRDELLSTSGGMSGYFRSLIVTRVKTHLAKTLKENNINVLEVDEHLDELSSSLRIKINDGLAEYGLTMPEFFVMRLVTPDDDPNFKKLKSQHAERYLRVQDEKNLAMIREAEQERKEVEARTAVKMTVIHAEGETEVAKRAAEATLVAGQAEAEVYRMKAEAEAKEMQMKGYTYAQETQRQVGLEAMQGGIIKEGSGGGAGGGMGDIVGLGVGLGAIGSVIGLAKDAISPIAGDSSNIGKTALALAEPPSGGWDCTCGEKITNGNFCNTCGTKRPELPKAWACPKCGTSNDKGVFCNNCGEKNQTTLTWDCSCGEKSIKGNFCNICGKKKEDN